MSDRIRLGDDGTLDTVLVCRECGQEARYNYDAPDFADDPPDGWDECEQCGGWHPEGYTAECRQDVTRWPSTKCVEKLAVDGYQAWVDSIIEDFDSEHVCEGENE